MIFVRILVSAVFVNAFVLERKAQSFVKHEQMCNNMTEEPYFKETMVIGPIWRIYYAWNMIMGNQCMDLTFKRATNMTIHKFREDMYSFVNNMPAWSNATLVMTMDTSREMLLIPESLRKTGRYVGVPNVHKGDYLGASRGSVSLFKMAVKLLHEGRYLLMGDCVNGVVSMLVRRDQKHTWGEVTSVVKKVGLKFSDVGYPACKFNMRKKIGRHPTNED